MLHHCQERALGPVPQRMSFLASQAGKPVNKRLIENGATSQMKLLWGVGVERPARPKNTTQDARQLITKSLRKKNCRLSEVETGFLTTGASALKYLRF